MLNISDNICDVHTHDDDGKHTDEHNDDDEHTSHDGDDHTHDTDDGTDQIYDNETFNFFFFFIKKNP